MEHCSPEDVFSLSNPGNHFSNEARSFLRANDFWFSKLDCKSYNKWKAVWAAVIFLTGIKTPNHTECWESLHVPVQKQTSPKNLLKLNSRISVEAGLFSIPWITWLLSHTVGKDHTFQQELVFVHVWPPVGPLDHLQSGYHRKISIRMSIFDNSFTISKLWKNLFFL
jgi:hypothetical protein